jgi:hypothetical protein
MKKRKGWRAIIYDAPWAYFKKGQSGVIVSEDGKSCETVDDDKSNIKIIAYKNDTYYPKGIGHVLFRQKGSDLFDIVCLYQNASEKPEEVLVLHVDNVNLDGCTATYRKLLELLNVYWTKGTETTKCTKYNLITPTPQDVYPEGETLEIKVTASIGTNEYEATGACYISAASEETTSYTNTVISIDCIKNFVSKVTGGSSTQCGIYPTNVSLECEGGNYTFSINKVNGSDPVYEIGLSCAGVLNYFSVTQCGEEKRTYSEHGELEWSVVSGNVTILQTSPTLKISVTPGVTSVTLKATEKTYGVSETITITLPS